MRLLLHYTGTHQLRWVDQEEMNVCPFPQPRRPSVWCSRWLIRRAQRPETRNCVRSLEQASTNTGAYDFRDFTGCPFGIEIISIASSLWGVLVPGVIFMKMYFTTFCSFNIQIIFTRLDTWISFGNVAENIRVCLSPVLGMLYLSMILRIWSSNPISSIRSASSKTRYLSVKSETLPFWIEYPANLITGSQNLIFQSCRWMNTAHVLSYRTFLITYLIHSSPILPLSSISIRRPGVPTSRWQPLASSRAWLPKSAPPYTTHGRTWDLYEN